MAIERESGQALMESLLSLGVAAVLVSGAYWAFHAQWKSFKCAHDLFEATRSALEGGSSPVRVHILAIDGYTQGEIQCAGKTVRLRLRDLDRQAR